MRKSRWLLGPVLALALTGLPTVGAHADAATAPAPTPGPSFTAQPVGGPAKKLFAKAQTAKQALKAQAGTLRAAARANGTSAAHLKTALSNDPTLRLGADGRMFYADQFDAAPVEAGADTAVKASPWATYPLSQALTLHSDPGSAHTIYLDFNGYTMPASSYWSDSAGLSANHAYGGFSLDATTTGAFSTAEQQYIQDVWRIISEKYAAMDVDVTTQDPGSDALNRTSSGDTTYGTRVVITNDMSARPTGCTADSSGGCLGVGLIGVFNENVGSDVDYLAPAWVFSKFTSADDVLPAGLVASDAAHEIGHTLGLYHDRTSSSDYYPGHDDWFPIMGASDLAIGQFNNGGYTGYVSDQVDPGPGGAHDDDDYNVMNLNGLPTRSDDVSGTATLGSAASYTESGIIETPGDVDTYQVNRTCTNALTATATGIGLGQSVDLKVTIKDPSNVTQATDDPAAGHLTPRTFPDTPTGMDASAEVASATTGLWTVSVQGVGLAGSTGYSNYGSRGQYNLTITGCSGSGGTAPDAPTGGFASLTARSTTATIHWAAPVNHGDSALTGYEISGEPIAVPNPSASATSAVLTGLVPGTTYNVKVAAVNSTGGSGATLTIPVTVQTWVPTKTPGMTITVSKNKASIGFVEPSNPGQATFTEWRITINNGPASYLDYNVYNGLNLSKLGNGTYTVKLALLGDADLGTVTPTKTSTFRVGMTAPKIGAVINGKSGGPVTVGIKWGAPSSTGGVAITGYRAIAYKLSASNKIVKSYVTNKLSASARSFNGSLPAGRYKFRVVPYNAFGEGPVSAYSKVGTAK